MYQRFGHEMVNDIFQDEEFIDAVHRKGKRKSTKGKHQKGEKRVITDQGGEKGDARRGLPRKRPAGHKGPWPPKKSKFDEFLLGDDFSEASLFDSAAKRSPLKRVGATRRMRNALTEAIRKIKTKIRLAQSARNHLQTLRLTNSRSNKPAEAKAKEANRLEREIARVTQVIQKLKRDLVNAQKQLGKGSDRYDDFLSDDLDTFDFAARPISPWPRLLKQAIRALQRALLVPANTQTFTNRLYQAQQVLNQAAREVRKVMSGSRLRRVMDQLSNAVIRIDAARAQARGHSLVGGGRSSIDPKVSVRGAIAHIRQAQDAVGLA